MAHIIPPIDTGARPWHGLVKERAAMRKAIREANRFIAQCIAQPQVFFNTYPNVMRDLAEENGSIVKPRRGTKNLGKGWNL